MDFDDLDDAIDQRIAEGDIASLGELVIKKAELKKFALSTGLPPMPRDHRLPVSPDLAQRLRTPGRKIGLRAFFFPGPGLTAELFHGTATGLPDWLELAAYEWPGHGARSQEPLASDLDALAEDAFEAVRLALEEVKAGAALEGGPFAFIGHSVGAQVMALVAKKVLQTLGLEPSQVAVVDRAPLHLPLLSKEGQEALRSQPDEVLRAYSPEQFDVIDRKLFANDLRYGSETKGALFHKFQCDALVLTADWDRERKIVAAAPMGSPKYTMLALQIEGSDETLQLPVEDGTKVGAVRDAIAPIFAYRKGQKVTLNDAAGKPLSDGTPAKGKIIIDGLVDFQHPRYPWPHPTVVIGTGFWGVKVGMEYMFHRNENLVLFDRHETAGGFAWHDSATKHSKVQTDLGAFNIWFGHEWVYSGEKGFGASPESGGRAKFCQAFSGPGAPTRGPFAGTTGAGTGVDYNPVRAQVLGSLQFAMEEYGFKELCNFSTDVTGLKIRGGEAEHDRSYELTFKSLGHGGGNAKTMLCSVIYHFPGAYCTNRIIDYPGERDFGGQIGYGMGNGQGGIFVFDHEKMQGSRAAILGNGAFAVENVRSCCENGASKVFIVTRRKSLACPRMPCWFCHQGPAPTPAWMLLNIFKPMYELAGMEDPWSFYAVNKITETNTKITQSSRFGIGDVTFLCHAWGLLEYRVTTLERCSHKTLHLANGEKLEDMSHLCKALGLIGDATADKLHSMTHRIGNMINGDWRRVTIADATGMDANRFTTFSAGPGACSFAKQWHYVHNHPWEMYKAIDDGVLKLMPLHKISNTQPDQTVYMTNVSYDMAAGAMFSNFLPNSNRAIWDEDSYMHCLLHSMHPTDKMLEYCKADWDRYQEMFKKHNGCGDREYLPYPYTKEMIRGWFEEYNTSVKPFGGQLNTTLEGPSEEFKQMTIKSFQDNNRQLARDLARQLVLDSKLHKGRLGNVDPYALTVASIAVENRQQFMTAKQGVWANLATGWQGWVGGDFACEVRAVDAPPHEVMFRPETWFMLTETLDAKSAHHNGHQARAME